MTQNNFSTDEINISLNNFALNTHFCIKLLNKLLFKLIYY